MNCLLSFNKLNQNFVRNGFQWCLSNVLINYELNGLRQIVVHWNQKRYFAARKGKRIEQNRQKQKLARIRREEEKNIGPKVWVPPHFRIDKSALNVGPRRFSDKDRKDLDLIVDDVYIKELYKEINYQLLETIEMHRETHHKTIYNDSNALIDAKVELDLRVKKKNRYLDSFKGMISYPNKFEFKVNRKIIAICKKEEDQFDAKAAGADIVGSSEIIKMLQKGELNITNFDDLVCHGDMLIELAAIRGVIMNVFPSKLRGNLGFDMKKLVNTFVNGIDYKLVKDEFEPDYGWVRVPFSRLDLPDEQIQQNLMFLLSHIEKHKPALVKNPFITRVLISSEPSKEEFAIKFWEYIDGYEDPNIPEEVEIEEKVEKTEKSSKDSKIKYEIKF